MMQTPESGDAPPEISIPRLANFVRQITHDVRNGLNAIDLQAAFVAEIAEPGEVSDELGKLRGMVNHVTKDMQELSSRFGEVRPVLMEYPISELVITLKEAVHEEFDTQAKRLVWKPGVPTTEMTMDYTLLMQVLLELIRNAIFFREGDFPIDFSASIEGDDVLFAVAQKKKSPITGENEWGRVALTSGRRGGYGLGLYYVRRVLETLGGKLEPAYDASSGELTVRLRLPLRGQPGRAE